ncbi:hypothetical protein D8674_017201 [Pyrus ussuriensis x Pyrus communis]|uniref:Uncharacterized protein n=1 Tax=Pyrus ussuriensis x Pyrus communis TaxID=2448454 RepID=A0A5N5HH96_9ROSA|nr:hypothetical protein D8674_017201 [Pyrus ussuriensis x Pyrus communis]
MPLEPRASWSASETMGDKLHRREGNSPDHQLRPLNDRSVIKEVGVQRQPGVFCLKGSTHANGDGGNGSENVGLSNTNISENPMPRNLRVPPQGSSTEDESGPKIRVRRGRENASSQCSSTKGHNAKVTHNSNLVSGPTGQGTVSGRQFLWGVGLPKGNGGVQRFPRARRRLVIQCKGREELDCKTHPSSGDKSRP